jgi:hypothetical protein
MQLIKTSKTLGIIGGSVFIVLAIVTLVLSLFTARRPTGGGMFSNSPILTIVLFLPAALLGLLAVWVAYRTDRNPHQAGIFQIITGLVLILFTSANLLFLVSSLLIIIAGILALVGSEQGSND